MQHHSSLQPGAGTPFVNKTQRRLSITLVIIGVAGTLYFWWARVRLLDGCLWEPRLWRGFPYPDPWMLELYDWFDYMNPNPPGTIKLHGEMPRMLRTLLILRLVSASILFVGVLPLCWLAWNWMFVKPPGVCPACGYDLRGNTDSKDCPECGKPCEQMQAGDSLK